MAFPARHASPRHDDRRRPQALEAWRTASALVRERWQLCLQADRESRPFMFAAYHAALDREAAAADALAGLSFREAA